MKTVIVYNANATAGPIVAAAIRNAGKRFWSLHGMFEGCPGKEGTRWQVPFDHLTRAYALLAAVCAGVPYVLTCKPKDVILATIAEDSRLLSAFVDLEEGGRYELADAHVIASQLAEAAGDG